MGDRINLMDIFDSSHARFFFFFFFWIKKEKKKERDHGC
jgi:hypothetical protein